MMHPPSLELEALACGDVDANVAAHVDECFQCRAYVDRLREHVVESSTTLDVSAMIAKAVASASASSECGEDGVHDQTRRALPVRSRMSRIVTATIPSLAIAACIVLLLRAPPEVRRFGEAQGPSSASSQVALVQMGAPVLHESPEITFKGGVQVAVVRERAGAQERFSSSVPVRAGDRLRLEVALDREQVILGALMGDDGSFLELMHEGARGAGLHLSERSARVDANPTQGTFVIGAPEAVTRARETKRFDGLAIVRIELEQAHPRTHESAP